jgi:hypothetical protein
MCHPTPNPDTSALIARSTPRWRSWIARHRLCFIQSRRRAGASDEEVPLEHSTKEIRSEVRNGLERLRALKDEARLQVHLASLDAKKRWDELQPQLQAVERTAEEASEASRKVIADGVKALEELLATIRRKQTRP